MKVLENLVSDIIEDVTGKKKKYSIIFGLFRACVDGCSCQHRASSYKSTVRQKQPEGNLP